jgi:predicted dehydrogenase
MAEASRLRARGLAGVVAACGRERQRRHAVEEMGIPRFTTEASEITRASDVDLVVVLTSMRSHGPLARAALEAGKHVLVEKPLAVDLDEARELVSLARRSPGILACAPFTVLSPTFSAIARRIRAGEIGRPASARARYGWAGPSWNRWFYEPGGGALSDLGVYSITTLTGLLGPARRVTAMTGAFHAEREVDGGKVRVEAEDNAQVLIDFGGSAFGVVTTGFTIQQYRTPALEVYGSEGTIQMMGDDWDPDGYELWRNDMGSWQVFKETAPDWPWTDGLRHAVECIRGGGDLVPTPEHAYHVLEILEAARASGKDGRARDISSRFEPIRLRAEAGAVPAHLVHDRTRGE